MFYRGKVGTGFTLKNMKEIHEMLSELEVIRKTDVENTQDEKNTTWIAPHYICEIQYSSITSNKTFREPVFLRMRPDLEYQVDL